MFLLKALETALFMFWQVLWPLVLGFLISAFVQARVPRSAVVAALGIDDLRGAGLATLLGAASSSCSYAAVAVARGLFRKGATLANAILFEFASTNLVFELGLVLLVLLGWQFVAAEFAGGLLMIAILAVAFKYTLRGRLVDAAHRQAEQGLSGRMEGHGEMDMSSSGTFTAVSHYFFMDVASLWQDLLLGLLIAGVLAAWVPDGFWRALFLSGQPGPAMVWGSLIGPVIALLSFVCSIGNVPLAAVLWNGGISFGGVVSFIFGDLIILPILNIYRKYYGGRVSLYLLAVSYAAMVLSGLLIGLAFQALGLVPPHRALTVLQAQPAWDWTAWLNLASLAVAAVLGWRFLRTDGPAMLRHMNMPAGAAHHQHHEHHEQHEHHAAPR